MAGTSSRWLIAGALAMVPVAGLVASPAARAEDNFIREVKVGGLYHDPGFLWSRFSLEPHLADVNIEVQFGPHVDVLWGSLRPVVGATVNTRGFTSKAYVDARWEIESPTGIFFALGIGAAVHDGTIGPTAYDRKALGSRVLFHVPAEIGWRWDGHNSVSVYFEHISNGYTQDYNEGLDAIGLRYGYRF